MRWRKYEESGNPTTEIAFKKINGETVEKVVSQHSGGVWEWMVNIYPDKERYKRGISTSKTIAKYSASRELNSYLRDK